MDGPLHRSHLSGTTATGDTIHKLLAATLQDSQCQINKPSTQAQQVPAQAGAAGQQGVLEACAWLCASDI
jgi:hypothetical protein